MTAAEWTPASAAEPIGVAAALARHARRHPDRTAVTAGARRWTFAELDEVVSRSAATMRDAGVGPGDRVAVALGDPADQLRWALAADRLDGCPAVLDPRWPAARSRAALDSLRAAAVVNATGVVARPGAAGSGGAGWIAYTSGSSGTPRAVARTRRSWTASFAAFTELTGLGRQDRVLVPGGLSSSMCAFAALHALHRGAALDLLSGWDPVLVPAACTVAHLVPTMLRDLVIARSPLRARLLISAGAALDPELERAARAVWPGTRVLEYYGSSEQSFVSVRTGPPGSVGTAFPGVQIQIRATDRSVLPPGRPGLIWTRSPFSAQGYLDDAGGRFRRCGDWVSVGDRGTLDSTGTLRLLGRDTVVTGGTTVDPAAVEGELRTVAGVQEAVVFGLPHPRLGEVVVAVLTGQLPPLRVLRAHARDRLAPAERPRRWFALPTMPVTTGGKPARAELLAAAREGRLRPVR